MYHFYFPSKISQDFILVIGNTNKTIQFRTVYSIGYLKVHKESKKQKKNSSKLYIYIYIYIQLGRKMSITTLLSLRP